MRLNTTRLRVATAVATVAVATFALSACSSEDDITTEDAAPAEDSDESQASAANEYPGEFTVANGDSTFYVGDGPHRPESVTVMCSETSGVITAILTESSTRNEFTTTQPENGAGYAGGTLTLGDSGEEITWVPLDDLDDDTIRLANSHPDARGDARVFEDDSQEGSPVTWEADGTFEFGYGLKVVSDAATDEEQETLQQVQAPGRVDCSNGAAIPE
ncbi:hypothetical protein ACTXKZ_08035 [Brachybacterium alimentarium]|uniref:hypothetical protein n=1 Tax=Brachybacterium alimentarium TaxID=47845 RepID=UPI003FD57A15